VINKSPPAHIEALEKFYDMTTEKLKALATEVQASNTEIRKLEAEIKRLKEKKANKPISLNK